MVFDLPGLAGHLDIALADSVSVTDRSTIEIMGVNTLELASKTDLCFAEHPDQAERVAASSAGAVLVSERFPSVTGPLLLRVVEPRVSFFRIAEQFAPVPDGPGIHDSAQVDATARIADAVSIGACAVIGADVRIGTGCVVGPGCWLGEGVSLGAGCVIESNVSLHPGSELGERCVIHSGAVIGSDGFGFDWDGKRHRKVPQLGRVVIEDDVDIGCNCCIDRATLGETRIRRGVRIDNLVQVAHNTDIGEHVILVSQSGLAGSSSVGTGAVIAGQVAVSDHVKIGAGARIGGQSGVTKDVPAGAAMFGTPARPMKNTLRELAALVQLPTLLKQIKRQQQQIDALQAHMSKR